MTTSELFPEVEPAIEPGRLLVETAHSRWHDLEAAATLLETQLADKLPTASAQIRALLEHGRAFVAQISWTGAPVEGSNDWEAYRSQELSTGEEVAVNEVGGDEARSISLGFNAGGSPRHLMLVSPAAPWQMATISQSAGGDWYVQFSGTGGGYSISSTGVMKADAEIKAGLEGFIERFDAPAGNVGSPKIVHEPVIESADVLSGRILADSPEEAARWTGGNILPGLGAAALAAIVRGAKAAQEASAAKKRPAAPPPPPPPPPKPVFPPVPEVVRPAAAAPVAVTCSQCGKPARPGARFCVKCGTRFS